MGGYGGKDLGIGEQTGCAGAYCTVLHLTDNWLLSVVHTLTTGTAAVFHHFAQRPIGAYTIMQNLRDSPIVFFGCWLDSESYNTFNSHFQGRYNLIGGKK